MKFVLKKRIYFAVASVIYLVLSEYGVISLGEAQFNQIIETLALVLTAYGVLSEPKKVEDGMNKDEEIGL